MNGNFLICRAIAALGRLADCERPELQRVLIRVDREGLALAAADGHVGAIICSENTYDLPQCDGFLPGFVAESFNVPPTNHRPADIDEDCEQATYGYQKWASHWRELLRPVPQDGLTFEKIFKASGKPRDPMAMPQTLPQVMELAVGLASQLGTRNMVWCAGSAGEPIRVDACLGDPRAPALRLVLAIMPARAEGSAP